MSEANACTTCGSETEERELGWVHKRDGSASCGAAGLRVVPESERRDPDECPHAWSPWLIGPYFPREERFCPYCGSMEMQGVSEGTPQSKGNK